MVEFPVPCPECGADNSALDRECGVCGAQFGSPAGPPAPAEMGWGGALAVVGGLAAALGSFLPWATASALVVSVSKTGMEGGDGLVTLVVGLLTALAGAAVLAGSHLMRGVCFLGGAALAGVAVFEMADVSSRMADLGAKYAFGAVGIGLGVVLVGGAVAVIGSLLPMSALGAPAPSGGSAAAPAAVPAADPDFGSRLRSLAALRDEGLISEDEFWARREEILRQV
jgi:hypothetical protein